MKDKLKIDGVPCAMVVRGGANGVYLAVFSRDKAGLDEIEGIRWAAPEVSGSCVLPKGYGFQLAGVNYSPATRNYTATLQVAEQYLGDVTGYQARIKALEAENAEKRDTIREMEDRLADADGMVMVLYEQIEAAANPPVPPEDNSGEEAEA